jgi:hypothetical protein
MIHALVQKCPADGASSTYYYVISLLLPLSIKSGAAFPAFGNRWYLIDYGAVSNNCFHRTPDRVCYVVGARDLKICLAKYLQRMRRYCSLPEPVRKQKQDFYAGCGLASFDL